MIEAIARAQRVQEAFSQISILISFLSCLLLSLLQVGRDNKEFSCRPESSQYFRFGQG
jgi:hypothetical protein